MVEEENEDQERIYGDKNDSNSKGPQEDISLQVSPVLIMCFVCMMCLMLLLLYFFFDKLGEVFFLQKIFKKCSGKKLVKSKFFFREIAFLAV